MCRRTVTGSNTNAFNNRKQDSKGTGPAAPHLQVAADEAERRPPEPKLAHEPPLVGHHLADSARNKRVPAKRHKTLGRGGCVRGGLHVPFHVPKTHTSTIGVLKRQFYGGAAVYYANPPPLVQEIKTVSFLAAVGGKGLHKSLRAPRRVPVSHPSVFPRPPRTANYRAEGGHRMRTFGKQGLRRSLFTSRPACLHSDAKNTDPVFL